jgi:hypothetical protein
MQMSKKIIAIGFVLALSAGWLLYNSDGLRNARIVKTEIARNVAARGGADAWEAVKSLRLAGQMDLGQGMHVPYVLEQKRPGKMCLEFEFDDMNATQCVDGDTGWKRLPFRGRNIPEPMTDAELREMAHSTEIGGLLFNARERGLDVEFVGEAAVNGQPATKLAVTLPSGAVRWVYVDKETGLDVKLDTRNVVRGQERLVETYYYDWQETDGLMIPRRQETFMEGADESHFLTVDKVEGNPELADSRFTIPALSRGASS